MSQLPTRSLRLRSYATTDLDRLTGEKGEIFYDSQEQTLKIYNGAGTAPSTVNVGTVTSSTLTNGTKTVSLDSSGNLNLPVGGDVKNSSGQGVFALLANNYITNTSLGVTLNSYMLKGTVEATVIDSSDSSAITVIPSTIFSSDVTVENELTINTGIIKNAEATWQLNGTALELPEYGAVQSRSAVTIQAYDVDQSGGAINGSGSGFYAEIFAMVYGYDDVIIRANNNGSTKDWDFQADGRLVFPVAAVPARSFGAAGDRRGMLAIDDSYIYYCTANYVNNSTNIWKRTAHGAGTW